MALKSSQKDMDEHSAKKVELLQSYLTEYLSVLGNDRFTQEINCYDLFCGEGLFPNGGKGSPLIFVEALKAAAEKHPATKFSFFFNDLNKSKVEAVSGLIESLKPFPSNLATHPSNRTYSDVCQLVILRLASSGKSKSLLFIDPYGYKDVKPSSLKPLLQYNNAEVILFQPTQHMFRFSKAGTPEALEDYLNELLEGDKLPEVASVMGYLDFVTGGFRRIFSEMFVDRFTIKKDPSTMFCLYFFTPNHKGAEKMLEAKWKLDEHQGQGWTYQSAGMGLLPGFGADINLLEKQILALLKTKQQTNADIYDAAIRSGFLPKQAREVLVALQKEGRIKVNPPSTKKGAFYLSYGETFGADTSKRRPITISLT